MDHRSHGNSWTVFPYTQWQFLLEQKEAGHWITLIMASQLYKSVIADIASRDPESSLIGNTVVGSGFRRNDVVVT
jgi:hypothetical protein